MKRIFSCILVVAALGVAALPAAPGFARAAALAEDHTVLYYLMDMQRRAKRNCDGAPMPEPPSLMPSETLRSLARNASTTGAQAVGKDGSPLFTAFCAGQNPRQAVENLLAAQCRAVMSPEWRYIGAYGESGNWTVVMASRDPDQWIPEEPGQTGSQTVSREGGQTNDRADSAGASVPAVTTAAAGTETASPSTGPDTAKNEPTEPARPVVVREIEIDALGRPILPSGTPPALTPPSLPAPGVPATGENLGPKTAHGEPVRPASPVPVGSIEVDAFGRPILPPQRDPQVAPPSSAPASPSGAGVTPLSDMRASPPSGALYGTNQAPVETLSTQANPAGQKKLVVGTAPVRVAGAEPDPMTMLGLVNEIRATGAICAGTALPPAPALAPDAKLMEIARQHAGDMAARNYFSSTSPENVTLGQRLTRQGYSWGFLAENIARGVSSPGKTLESWLAGGEPCRTIMDAQFTRAGVGFAKQGSVWVLTVAAPGR